MLNDSPLKYIENLLFFKDIKIIQMHQINLIKLFKRNKTEFGSRKISKY